MWEWSLVSPKLFKGLLGCIGSLYVFAVATSASASTVELLDVQWNQGSVYAQVNLNGTDNPSTDTKPVDAPGTPKAHASLSAGSQSGTASASVTVSLKPSQELLASASTDSVGALATADAVVQLTYQIEILGAPGLVDLTVQSKSYSTSAGAGDASTELDLKGMPGPIVGGPSVGYTYETGSNGGAPLGGFAESFNLNETYTTQADLPFAVSMLVSAASQNFSTGSGSGTSYLDPYFSVPNGYSILLSNGVGNSLPPAVPEIPTWSMMLFGFSGLGFWVYRYRTSRKAVSVGAA